MHYYKRVKGITEVEKKSNEIRARVVIDSTRAKEKGEERSQESGVRSKKRKRKSTIVVIRKRLEIERHGTGLMKV